MRICPICKSEYPDDCKFCENDGSPLEDKDGKKCPHCGAQLKGKGKFCPQCGKSTEVVEEKGCHCPKCGFESDEKVKFCPDCGYSFADEKTEYIRRMDVIIKTNIIQKIMLIILRRKIYGE